jgi:predicted membrane protein
MLLTIMMGTLFTVALLLAVAFLSKQALGQFVNLLLLGLVVVLEESALGICIAGKFPDFRETVRSRYVSLWGSILGTMLGLVVAGATAAPILLADTFQIAFPPTLIGIVIGFLVFVALWKLAIRQVNGLLTEIQV